MYVVTGKESGETRKFETLEEAVLFVEKMITYESWIISKE